MASPEAIQWPDDGGGRVVAVATVSLSVDSLFGMFFDQVCA